MEGIALVARALDRCVHEPQVEEGIVTHQDGIAGESMKFGQHLVDGGLVLEL